MTTTRKSLGKPGIVVSDSDYRRLSDLASSARQGAPEVAEELQAELDRAKVVPDDTMPGEVARMRSTVVFRADNAPPRRVTLVLPGEADIAQNRISILTPIGAALIGLSAGQSITWRARDGREHELTVESVTQPEAAGAEAGASAGAERGQPA